ncbi:Aste57867_17482 [Aphanomyces stellatus]|uniref:Aste57867_17482 protein n=1 Tax=Aphanomyces stellatus TaxID=120398 RepID=A0A485L844_9STRA|nr:hypothetical protein As57867_017422 [Aphanomyces stellatus]VFT94235.1 Aste57867_17482 [Aphanomyces stellatus]
MRIASLLVVVASASGQMYYHRCTGGPLSNAKDGGDRLERPHHATLVDPWTKGKLCEATYQDDGNFVLYKSWYMDPSILGQEGKGRVIMQGDGNLILELHEGLVAQDFTGWNSDTSKRGTGPYCLTLSMSCHLNFLDSDSQTIWFVPKATATRCAEMATIANYTA